MVVVVVVRVHRPVGVTVEPTHQHTSFARSIEAMRNSSPLTSSTSVLPHVLHTRIGRSSVVAPAARAALDDRGHVVDRQRAARQLGAVDQEVPREQQRVGHHLTEVADAHLHPLHAVPVGVARDRVDDGLAERELVHQRSFPAHARHQPAIATRPVSTTNPVSSSSDPARSCSAASGSSTIAPQPEHTRWPCRWSARW